MNKARITKLTREAAGYTLVEVLTALVILFIIFLPVSKICSQLLSSPDNRDRIIAINLAEAAMNRVLVSKKFQNDQWTEIRQQRSFLIDLSVEPEGELLRVEIAVYRHQAQPPLTTLYTFRPAFLREK